MSPRLPMILAMAVLSGCMNTHAETHVSEAQVVRVARVTEGEPTAVLTLQGVTRAADRARLGFPVGGRVQSRSVRVGDRVQRGDVLARLDPRGWQNGVSAQSARVTELNARIAQLDRDLARLVKLEATGSAVVAERERLQTERDAAVSALGSLDAQLQEARRQLSDSVLTAPFDGVVVAVAAEPGETVGAGTPVVELAGEGLEVAVEVPEGAWVRLTSDTVARVRLPALDLVSDASLVDLAGAGGGRGGLFPVVVALPAGDRRVAGLTAEVQLEIPVESGLIAPVRAIVDPTGEAPAVFQIDDGVAHRMPVALGSLHGNGVVVRGVDAGAEVVVAGHAQLADGQAVEVLRD
ncbi:MAG: efflux RND transporter periplasmic adaptor subunit [Myxococcota bacterium]